MSKKTEKVIIEPCCEVANEEEEYYVKAFKRLDETGKHTWNWAAFFFCGGWMLYRKMYFYFIFFFFFKLFINFIVGTVSQGGSAIISWIVTLSLSSFFGYFGNNLYYAAVKEQIREGYHLMDKYKPTSVTSCVPIFGFLVGLADQISLKKQVKTRGENEINEETIRACLNSSRENPGIVKVANVIVWLSLPVLFWSIVSICKIV